MIFWVQQVCRFGLEVLPCLSIHFGPAGTPTFSIRDANPRFHLHTRWQEQTTSVKPKEMRDTYATWQLTGGVRWRVLPTAAI